MKGDLNAMGVLTFHTPAVSLRYRVLFRPQVKTEIKEWIKEFEEREGRPPTNGEKVIQSIFYWYILNVETAKICFERSNHSLYLPRQRKCSL